MQGLNLCKVNTTNITDPEYEQSLIEDFSDTFTIKPKETLILSYVCSRMATWTTADSEYARKVTDTAEMLLWKPIEMLLWKPILSWSVKDTHYTFDLSNIYSMSHDMEIQIDTGRVIGFACKNLIYGEMLPSGPVYGDRPNIRGQHFLNLLNTLPAQKEFLLGRYACYFVTKEVTLHT
jgi:hypothetical protein